MGDFLRMDLSRGFVSVWDAWLQQSLQASRAALGDRFAPAYNSAPIWRFTLAPGLAGRDPVFGVMMPSVDRVGRAFPLTLAGRGAGAEQAVFEALEEVALAALEPDATRAHLAATLARVPPSAAPASASAGATWRAVLAHGQLDMTTPGLPLALDARRLFDLALWPARAAREVSQ